MFLKKALPLVSLNCHLEELNLLWLPISKVVHNHIQSNNLIWFWQKRHLINWNQSKIIKLIEFIILEYGWVRIWVIAVIYEPSSRVPVQIVRQNIEERLNMSAGHWDGNREVLTVSMLAMIG